ncbi:uncharacterized protein [Procambarus clarkii]|uniref:uncharacterized protein n=1 Tax=Procambarus clarkii TaxID=6728 RepID=UPI00374227C4
MSEQDYNDHRKQHKKKHGNNRVKERQKILVMTCAVMWLFIVMADTVPHVLTFPLLALTDPAVEESVHIAPWLADAVLVDAVPTDLVSTDQLLAKSMSSDQVPADSEHAGTTPVYPTSAGPLLHVAPVDMPEIDSKPTDSAPDDLALVVPVSADHIPTITSSAYIGTEDLAMCADNKFSCLDGSRCLPMTWRCDGDRDCHDDSDELSCDPIVCEKDKFRCSDGSRCISLLMRCDFYPHCIDGSDEVTCVPE